MEPEPYHEAGAEPTTSFDTPPCGQIFGHVCEQLVIISFGLHPPSTMVFPGFFGALPLGQNFLHYLYNFAWIHRELRVTPAQSTQFTSPLPKLSVVGGKVRAQGISMLHVPFFPGVPHHGGQMSFLFPHAFMPLRHGVGFPPHV